MQIFQCPSCGTALYFHNTGCGCGQSVTFDPERQTMAAGGDFCTNREAIGCNWVAETGGLCRSCAMTETVPDLAEPDNLPLWAQTEAAKRWVLANLGRWGWFTAADAGPRPVFKLLSEKTTRGESDVVMGHADGLITLNVSEASDAVLVQRQQQFGELYRTMIGHLRHEIAHFLFLRLCRDPAFLSDFRARFGDETTDYAAALKAHYADPRPAGEDHVTSYAAAHPHEDWAETLAHVLHLTDLLDCAVAAGLTLPDGPPPGHDAYAETDTEALVTHAVALSIAMNHVNRGLDLPDIYPFVLTPAVRGKMAFVHGHLRHPPPG